MSNNWTLKRPDPNGAENIPLQNYIKSLPIAVFILNLKNNDEVIDMRQIDFSNREDKAWLSKVSVWAWSKGYSVETMTVADAEGLR